MTYKSIDALLSMHPNFARVYPDIVERMKWLQNERAEMICNLQRNSNSFFSQRERWEAKEQDYIGRIQELEDYRKRMLEENDALYKHLENLESVMALNSRPAPPEPWWKRFFTGE